MERQRGGRSTVVDVVEAGSHGLRPIEPDARLWSAAYRSLLEVLAPSHEVVDCVRKRRLRGRKQGTAGQRNIAWEARAPMLSFQQDPRGPSSPGSAMLQYKWRVQYQYLGRHSTPEAAEQAVENALAKAFGALLVNSIGAVNTLKHSSSQRSNQWGTASFHHSLSPSLLLCHQRETSLWMSLPFLAGPAPCYTHSLHSLSRSGDARDDDTSTLDPLPAQELLQQGPATQREKLSNAIDGKQGGEFVFLAFLHSNVDACCSPSSPPAKPGATKPGVTRLNFLLFPKDPAKYPYFLWSQLDAAAPTMQAPIHVVPLHASSSAFAVDMPIPRLHQCALLNMAFHTSSSPDSPSRVSLAWDLRSLVSLPDLHLHGAAVKQADAMHAALLARFGCHPSLAAELRRKQSAENAPKQPPIALCGGGLSWGCGDSLPQSRQLSDAWYFRNSGNESTGRWDTSGVQLFASRDAMEADLRSTLTPSSVPASPSTGSTGSAQRRQSSAFNERLSFRRRRSSVISSIFKKVASGFAIGRKKKTKASGNDDSPPKEKHRVAYSAPSPPVSPYSSASAPLVSPEPIIPHSMHDIEVKHPWAMLGRSSNAPRDTPLLHQGVVGVLWSLLSRKRVQSKWQNKQEERDFDDSMVVVLPPVSRRGFPVVSPLLHLDSLAPACSRHIPSALYPLSVLLAASCDGDSIPGPLSTLPVVLCRQFETRRSAPHAPGLSHAGALHLKEALEALMGSARMATNAPYLFLLPPFLVGEPPQHGITPFTLANAGASGAAGSLGLAIRIPGLSHDTSGRVNSPISARTQRKTNPALPPPSHPAPRQPNLAQRARRVQLQGPRPSAAAGGTDSSRSQHTSSAYSTELTSPIDLPGAGIEFPPSGPAALPKPPMPAPSSTPSSQRYRRPLLVDVPAPDDGSGNAFALPHTPSSAMDPQEEEETKGVAFHTWRPREDSLTTASVRMSPIHSLQPIASSFHAKATGGGGLESGNGEFGTARSSMGSTAGSSASSVETDTVGGRPARSDSFSTDIHGQSNGSFSRQGSWHSYDRRVSMLEHLPPPLAPSSLQLHAWVPPVMKREQPAAAGHALSMEGNPSTARSTHVPSLESLPTHGFGYANGSAWDLKSARSSRNPRSDPVQQRLRSLANTRSQGWVSRFLEQQVDGGKGGEGEHELLVEELDEVEEMKGVEEGGMQGSGPGSSALQPSLPPRHGLDTAAATANASNVSLRLPTARSAGSSGDSTSWRGDSKAMSESSGGSQGVMAPDQSLLEMSMALGLPRGSAPVPHSRNQSTAQPVPVSPAVLSAFWAFSSLAIMDRTSITLKDENDLRASSHALVRWCETVQVTAKRLQKTSEKERLSPHIRDPHVLPPFVASTQPANAATPNRGGTIAVVNVSGVTIQSPLSAAQAMSVMIANAVWDITVDGNLCC